MSDETQARMRVLVCGERMRRDDGAALFAADMLPEDARALAEVIEIGQLSVEALLEIPDGAAAIVADAAIGVAPGAVVTLPLERVAARAAAGGGAVPASSHALPPAGVLALAEELRGSPLRGSFVGIGGAEFGFGEGLSAPVTAGLATFAATLADEIRRLAAGRP
jgi:hydrogenase maturation protease